jgi:hypothetical protein
MMAWSTDEREPGGGNREHEARHAEYGWSHYVALIGAVRAGAKRLGYAIAVHGSLARDIDLIAVPWVEDPAPAERLVEMVFNMVKELSPTFASCSKEPTDKPHGRKAWSIHGDGTYVDLSIMPVLA